MRRRKVKLGRWTARVGKLVLSWRDPFGRRRTKEFDDDEAGRDLAGKERLKILRELDTENPSANPDRTIGQCAKDWLTAIRETVAPTTLEHYERNVKNHVLPILGADRRLVTTHSKTIREGLLGLLRQEAYPGKPYSKATARDVLGTLRAMFAWASDDMVSNPTYGVAKKLHLDVPSDVVKVMSMDEVGRFMRALDPAYFLHFSIYINTGVRLGEGFGIQERHVDFQAKTLFIQQQVYASGRVGPPKTAKGFRLMEISSKLAELIARTFDERRARGIVSPWLLEPQFNLPNPTKKQASNARYRVHTAMKKACALALLPSNLSTHSLRHTFATQHLTRGRTIEWVAAQMGDNPQVVWKTYAKWLKPKNSEAADDFTAQVEAAVANAGKVTKFAVRYRPLELGF